jgi:long-chain fatty acid transport protein
VLRINFSDVPSVGNLGPGIDPDGVAVALSGVPALDDGGCPSSATCLGNDKGMGFGWTDQTVYKLGVQYGVNNRLQVRAGYNYGKSPIPNVQLAFGTLAPATVEKHYSVGFTYRPNENLEVTGTYMYVASNNQTNCGLGVVDCAQIGMHQNVFGVSFGWVLDPGEKSMEEFGEAEWDGINFDSWYGGLGIGQSNYQDFAATSATTRSEAWKAYAGYQFNTYLGVEGGYVNLNDMTAQAGTVKTNIDTDAWMLGAVLSYPVTDKFSVMGKAGAAYMLADVKTKTGSALAVTTGDDGYDPYYGVGVSYALFDNLNLRAEWDRFDRDNYDIDLVSAGFALKF